MSILKLIFGTMESDGQLSAEPKPVSCERLEKRRCVSRKASYEEMLFGYVDDEGNVSATPPEPRA